MALHLSIQIMSRLFRDEIDGPKVPGKPSKRRSSKQLDQISDCLKVMTSLVDNEKVPLYIKRAVLDLLKGVGNVSIV